MMYCSNCGNQLSDDAAFCPHCGTPTGQGYVDQQTQANNGYYQNGYQQPPANNGYYQNGYQQPPANNGYYQNEYPYPGAQYDYAQQNFTANDPYAPQTNSRKPTTTRWPASAGVMAVIHLLFFSVATMIRVMYFPTIEVNYLTPDRYVYILMVIAIPVLFFVHTKKLAFLTAIPMVIMALLDWIPTIRYLVGDYFPPEEQALEWIAFSLSAILIVLYLIQMIVRSASAAMPVIYLILSIISLIFSHVVLLIHYTNGTGSYHPLSSAAIIGTIGTIFLTISYIIAMFSSRDK